MKCEVFYIGARFVVLEMKNGGKFEDADENIVSINGVERIHTKHTTISLYDLEPDTDYEIQVSNTLYGKQELKVHTLYELTTLNVRDFGAKGDGVSDDTKAIQCAIMCCPKNGRVLIPEGIYKTYSLFLKSDLVIEIAKSATLSAFTKREGFAVLPARTAAKDASGEYLLGSWEGDPADTFASILTGINVSNVVITGEGVIDGCASEENWWDNPKEIRIAARPRMLYLNRCQNVIVQGITVRNSPSWNLHPCFSENLKFIDIKIISPKVSPNTDGLNPESCKDVDILGVYFSVGDDCIALKSGKIYMGAKYKTPSSDIRIRKCCMRDGHGAIVLGSEMAGGIKDLLVEDCEFMHTDRGLRIKTRRGRGKDAIIDGVTFNRISMDHVMTPIVINTFYFCDPDGHSDYVQSKEKMPVDERTPELGEFKFCDINATNCHVAASFFYGLPEKKIKKVTFENVNISFAKEMVPGRPAMMDGIEEMTGMGLFTCNVEELELKNVSITGQTGEAIVKQ